MSRARPHHRSTVANYESDSDIELDLQELHSSSAYGSQQQDNDRALRHRQRIPLKDLGARRTRGYGRQMRGNRDPQDSEHVQLLHGDHEDQRDSESSLGPSKEDESLLPENGEGTHDPRNRESHVKPRSLYLRFPRFLRRDGRSPHSVGASRNITIGQFPPPRYPPNAVSNAKYTAWSFLPRTLYNEFSFFFNMYFLLVALSQIIPPLRIGYLSTYVAPLAFVLAITLGKEAMDDIARRRRDSEANKEVYTVLQLRDTSKSPNSKGQNNVHPQNQKRSILDSQTRLDAIEEEEEFLGDNKRERHQDIEADEIDIRSRDLNVGDVL